MNHAAWTAGAAVLPWAIMVGSALLAPRVSRPGLFFGVTVAPTGGSEKKSILRAYDRTVLMGGALGLLAGGAVWAGAPGFVLAWLLGPTMAALAGCVIGFVSAHKRALALQVTPTTEREAALVVHPSVFGGWVVQLLPFLFLAASAVALLFRWEAIPERIPIHWDIQGRPNGWAGKSVASVFCSLTVGIVICVLLSGINYGTTRGARRVASKGSARRGEERFIRLMSMALVGIQYWVALLLAYLALAPIRSDPSEPLPALLPVLVSEAVLIGGILLVAWRAGQGGWRWSVAEPGGGPAAGTKIIGDRTPDECWKWGLFYYNLRDAAVFVEKRFGIGWTINFGNPRGVLIMVGILGLVCASLTIGLLAGR